MPTVVLLDAAASVSQESRSRFALIGMQSEITKSGLSDRFLSVAIGIQNMSGKVLFPPETTPKVTKPMVEDARRWVRRRDRGVVFEPSQWPKQVELNKGEHWVDFAACRTAYSPAFENSLRDIPRNAIWRALMVCSGCEVMDLCLEKRLDSTIGTDPRAQAKSNGVRGGLTPKQQKTILKLRDEAQPSAVVAAEISRLRVDNYSKAIRRYRGPGI